jgi:hypothetical protein
MPKVIDWEEFHDIEEDLKIKELKSKINHKEKSHNKKEWKTLETKLEKKGHEKYVKNKKRNARKNNTHK